VYIRGANTGKQHFALTFQYALQEAQLLSLSFPENIICEVLSVSIILHGIIENIYGKTINQGQTLGAN